ncbi:MAG: hypothetical protein ABJI22_08895 [Maribacter sp.]
MQKVNNGNSEIENTNTSFDDFTKNTTVKLITILPKCITETHSIFNEEFTERISSKTVENCDYESIIINKKSSLRNSEVDLKDDYIGKRISLKESDYDRLFRVSDSQVSESIIVVADCYMPRHGLMFYDSELRLKGFLEICFECNRIETVGEVPIGIISFGEEMSNLKKIYNEYNLLNPN